MTRQLASLILCSGFAVLASACVTKSFVQEQVNAAKSVVQEQVSATETKLTQRVDTQEMKLRETSDRAAASRQATAAADQRLKGLDMRVGEVGAVASDAKTRAQLAAEATHDAAARLSQRLADRNRYRLVETRSIYFDSDRADIRSEGVWELEDLAKALRADANAVLELQGFADPRGSDRYNDQLTRERLEAVIRYLVQRHSIELRQMQAVGMGKVALDANQKASPETLAKNRRVDIRLLTPWSSWEDAQLQIDQTAPAKTATVIAPAPLPSAQPTHPATAGRPDHTEPSQPTQAATVVPPAQPGGPTSIAPDQPATPMMTDVPREPTSPNVTVKPLVDTGAAASTARSPRRGGDGDEFKRGVANRRLAEFLNSISSKDLGGKE